MKVSFKEEYRCWKKWFILSIVLTVECMIGTLFCVGYVRGVCLFIGILGALLIVVSLLVVLNAKHGVQLENDLKELEHLKRMSQREKQLLFRLGYTKDLYERKQIQTELDVIIAEHNSRLNALAERKGINID